MPIRPKYPAHYAMRQGTRPPKRRDTDIIALLPKDAAPPPQYPYGAARWFKQSNRGLYGGATRLTGFNVSEEFGNRTRRTWYPNTHMKRLWSKALNQWIRVKITARTLKTVDKAGGLDEYVLGRKAARVKELGPLGWKLRWVVLNSESVQERMKTDSALRRLYEGVEETRELDEKERGVEVDEDEEEGWESLEEGELEEDVNEDGRQPGVLLESGSGPLGETHMREQPMPPRRESRWQRLKSWF